MKTHTVYYSPIICTEKQECITRVRDIRKSMEEHKLTVEDIICLTDEGHSIQFALPVKKGWTSQSLFGVDLDNLHDISLYTLIHKLERMKLPPYAAFMSLGTAEQINPTRFHLYFALNNSVKDPDMIQKIIKLVCDTISSLTSDGTVDYQCTDTGRLFFPGHVVYSKPSKKILLKNVWPLADVLYSEHTVLLSRTQFIQELRENFSTQYNVPGTEFYPLPDIPDHILIGAEINAKKNLVLKFCDAKNEAWIRTLTHTSYIHNLFCIHSKYLRNHINIIDNNIKCLCSTNAQKSTEDKLYYAKVNKVYQTLYISTLANHLAAISGNEIFKYCNVKNEEQNLTLLADIFKTEFYSITKEMLLDNVNTFQDAVINAKQESYPNLFKLLSFSGRKKTFQKVMETVKRSIRCLPDKEITHPLQYIITAKIIAQKLYGKAEAYKFQQIHNLIRFFSEIGLISILTPEQYASHLKKGFRRYYNFRKVHHETRTVITVPWFDNTLLANIESKAQQFRKQHKTVKGMVKINAQNRDTYLALKNCVISTLNVCQYFTRSMLLDMVQEEKICKEGSDGAFIVDRYLPLIAKELHLLKENYTKELASHLPFQKDILKLGSSKLYFREDLFNDHDTDNSSYS